MPGDLTGMGEAEGGASRRLSEDAPEYTCKAAGHICPAVKEGECLSGILRIHQLLEGEQGVVKEEGTVHQGPRQYVDWWFGSLCFL